MNVFEYEIKDRALIGKLKKRIAFFQSLMKRYKAIGFEVDHQKEYGLITEFWNPKKPDSSLKKNDGLVTWSVLNGSLLQKEMEGKGLIIKFSEIRKGTGLKPNSKVYTIRNYNNARFVVLSDQPNDRLPMKIDLPLKLDVV